MVAITNLEDWMVENAGPQIIWYIKRLSGNDTLANGSHQAGPYISKDFLLKVFPSLNCPDKNNPDKKFDIYIDSHGDFRNVRAVWYNNKISGGGTRDETRLTNFGGSESALLDPENTGALTIFAFHLDSSGESQTCNVWVCHLEGEEDLLEDRIGPVDPGQWRFCTFDEKMQALFLPLQKVRSSCWLDKAEIPPAWLIKFPMGRDIIRKAVEIGGCHNFPVDRRLLKRRNCEYEIFRSLEQALEFPTIKNGFQSIDEFINHANSVLQRRKSRAGRSLELHTREIFIEEKLEEGCDFQYQAKTEGKKCPDFLFPSQVAYQDALFPANKLRMLAAKTTCKDRWRQIINEADRIEVKHLLTLQEGISEAQFREMTEAKVRLVVPVPLVKSYPKSVQPHLKTLEAFIEEVRQLKAC